MIVIWGANFSVIKFVLREFPQVSFNALRLALAAMVFLGAIRIAAGDEPPLTRRDWVRVAVLGVIGHFLYQLAFVAGVARTTASNSALIFGATPVAVAVMAAVAGHERIPALRWIGVALSLFGIYIIVGRQARVTSATALGDLLVLAGMLSWSLYSVLAQPLLTRHSPLVVTGYSIAIGAALYVAVAVPDLFTTDWTAISATSWVLMVLSSLLALVFAYIIWYTAVQRIGSSRTAVYSNLTPIVAMLVAALWLGEPIGAVQVIGATTILSGVFITRLARPSVVSSPQAR